MINSIGEWFFFSNQKFNLNVAGYNMKLIWMQIVMSTNLDLTKLILVFEFLND